MNLRSATAPRLERLERQNRRLTIAVGVLVASLAALVLSGAARPTTPADVVTAKRFVLVDDKGETLAVLGRGDEGFYGLTVTSYEEQWEDVRLGATRGDDYSGHELRLGGSVLLRADDTSDVAYFGNVQIGSEHDKNRRLDGVVVSDRSSSHARAILGSVDWRMSKTGIVERRPVSSLVLVGPDGERVFAAP